MAIVSDIKHAVWKAVKAAEEGEAFRRDVAVEVCSAYYGFLRDVDRNGKSMSEAVSGFSAKVAGLSSGKVRPVREGSAEQHLLAILGGVLSDGRKPFEGADRIADVFNSDCLFDGRSHAYFRSGYSVAILDKEAERLYVWSSRLDRCGIVRAVADGGKALGEDPVFSEFLRTNHRGLGTVWDGIVRRDRRSMEVVRKPSMGVAAGPGL